MVLLLTFPVLLLYFQLHPAECHKGGTQIFLLGDRIPFFKLVAPPLQFLMH